MFQMLLLAPEQKSRLQDYCAASVFIKVLMLRGYGFDEISFPRISFQKTVIASSTSIYLQIRISVLLSTYSDTIIRHNCPAAWLHG